MTRAITIAIDGYSSTGKSTLARELANRLSYKYVDTGAMYRAVTFFAIREKLFDNNELAKEDLIDRLNEIDLRFEFNADKGISEIQLNGENLESKIRDMAVSQKVSEIAAVSEVREKLVSEQQLMGKDGGVVMDGRDIGTVVFPNADLKIFMTAREDIRVERRFKELEASNKNITKEEIAANIKQRDLMDTTREDSPLLRADDAIVLDNSDLSPEEQLQISLQWARQAMSPNPSS